MYARAEELLVEIDAAVAPFFWSANSALIADGVIFTESRVSTDRLEKWDIQ